MEIKRFIPDSTIINRFYKSILKEKIEKELYDEIDYLNFLKIQEIEHEAFLIKIFQNIGIQATTKSDRYSLPFKEEIVEIQEGENTICKIFNFREFVRKIVLELLNKKVRKIRFYLMGDLIISKELGAIRANKIIYMKFRYVIHEI